jgi:hypothetical protein
LTDLGCCCSGCCLTTIDLKLWNDVPDYVYLTLESVVLGITEELREGKDNVQVIRLLLKICQVKGNSYTARRDVCCFLEPKLNGHHFGFELNNVPLHHHIFRQRISRGLH